MDLVILHSGTGSILHISLAKIGSFCCDVRDATHLWCYLKIKFKDKFSSQENSCVKINIYLDLNMMYYIMENDAVDVKIKRC